MLSQDLAEAGNAAYERRVSHDQTGPSASQYLPGYSRALIRVEHFRALIDEQTYDGKTSVRPS